MNADLVIELIDLAIAMAESQRSHTTVANTLLAIIQKAVHAYEGHTGETLNPLLIRPEGEI